MALNYLHSRGIVHRDIKSENILVDSDGKLKLTDVSCSSMFNSKNNIEDKVFMFDIEQSGECDLIESLKGTILWMAPEVINQKKYGRKADIWSFGCTLIELITGRNPWNNLNIDNYMQALYKIGKSELIPEYPKNSSKSLKSFLDCCLNRSYLERSNVKELLNHPFLQERVEILIIKI